MKTKTEQLITFSFKIKTQKIYSFEKTSSTDRRFNAESI